MPASSERIAFQEGARGVQTIYMTGRMQFNRKARLTAILQALD
jgi:hypothetical protein